MGSPITPTLNGRVLSLTPGGRVLQTPLSDATIWKRLKEAGFDEDSIKRRDKAALVSYIAKLEAQIFDLQHHMGLLILERKELTSKYEEVKASADAAELAHKRDQAAHLAALAESIKREESLKKALGVEKQCIASIEKALHEMRAESAESKVAADCKMTEALNLMESAQKKFIDAQAKVNAAEILQAEAKRIRLSAERKLQEFDAREDDLSRRISDFKADCDVKEKAINLERQTLSERQRMLQQEQERLLDAQALLNQREEYIASKNQELNRLEKELEASKSKFEKDVKAINDEKSELKLTMASLSQREEVVVEREAMVRKREQELLILQGKIASKESAESQKIVANHETILRARKSEFEAELEAKRKLVEDEMEAKRRSWELKEVDINQREDQLLEKEHELEVKERALVDKEKDAAEKSKLFEDKENILSRAEKDIESQKVLLLQERERIDKMKSDLQMSLESLEDKKKQVNYDKEKLENMKTETDELSVLEINLKEEVENVRSKKLELMAEEERMKGEKAKFEAEWELIDEKREELQKQAERVSQEREALNRFLKDERESLRLEKEAMRDQHRHDVMSLNREREEFMDKMVQERSEWFNKIQQEHADFLLGIEMQKRELESSVEKRREEVESYLREKEKAFELEKKNQLQQINSLREKVMEELEQVGLEMKKLETERQEINLERAQRDKEWAVLIKSIEDLKGQTHKLEKQRELLHVEREEISAQTEHLRKFEELKLTLERMEVTKLQLSNMESNQQKISEMKSLKQQRTHQKPDLVSHGNNINENMPHSSQKLDATSTPASARFSWIKRCSDLIFRSSPEKNLTMSEENSLISNNKDVTKTSVSKSDSSNCERPHMKYVLGEPKVILEVSHGGDIVKESNDIKSKITEDASRRIADTVAEQMHQTGRKRRGTNSDLDDRNDPLPVQRKSNKKRRHQEISSVNASGSNNHATSTWTVATDGSTENTDVLIMEKTTKISEVTHEITETVKIASLETPEHLHDFEVASNHERVIEINKVTEVAEVTNEGMLENTDGEHVQPSEDGSSKDDMPMEDQPLSQSDNDKVTDNIGKRTRSKQKL